MRLPLRRPHFIFAVRVLSALVLIGAFQNCDGFHSNTQSLSSSQSQPGGSLDAMTAQPFQCQSADAPAPTPLRRLNKSEYVNTIKTLLASQTSADLTAIMNELNPLIATIPDDVDAKFSRKDSTLDQAHVAGYLYVAKKLGSLVAATDARAKNFFGSCATAADLTSACMDQFLAGMGKKIFRRPLLAAEITTLKANFSSFVSDRNAFLAAQMLMSPHFLMVVEDQGVEISPGVLQLSPYELASRLSYHYLQNMPDDQLMAAAANGSLNTDAGLAAQIDRLANTPAQMNQAKATLGQFYTEWLGLRQLADPSSATGASYAAFANGDSLSKDSMSQEIQDMVSYYTFNVNGHFSDLLTSDISFAKSDDLAKIYKVAKWTGDVNSLIHFPAGERSGLLTRAAFLATSTTTTNPVRRGVRIRRDFLCDTLSPPPPNIANMVRIPEIDPALSTRQRYEHKTADNFCMGCHSQINPLGFALENFDAWGRYRTTEKIYDDNGQMLAQQSINPDVAPAIFPGDNRQIATPVQFNDLLAQSGKAQNCFVQQYFEFTYRQKPDVAQDGCALEDMRQSLVAGDGSLKNMLMSAAKSRAFRLRKLASP